MKRKIAVSILTALLLVALGGATVLAAGNGRQGDQWQETQGQADGSQGYTGTVTGTCTGVLRGTLDHCIYSYYNGYNSGIENGSYSECRNSSTCTCGGAHTFTDQDGDGICDYLRSADEYPGRSGLYSTGGSGQYDADGHHACFGHHGAGSGGHHRESGCR